MGERVRKFFQNRLNDDQLRDDRLRFQAHLQQGATWDKELYALYEQLRQWAPRLLDGEMLMSFYVDGLLRPLLAAGRVDLVWALLPQVSVALNASSGDKHAAQVQRVTLILANQVAPELADALTRGPSANDSKTDNPETIATSTVAGNGNLAGDTHLDPLQAHAELTHFLAQLWEGDVRKGLWQTVHGIEGSLALLLALEGADALMTLAQVALREGSQWVKPWQPKEKEAVPRGNVMG
jgi:hypothetical protein